MNMLNKCLIAMKMIWRVLSLHMTWYNVNAWKNIHYFKKNGCKKKKDKELEELEEDGMLKSLVLHIRRKYQDRNPIDDDYFWHWRVRNHLNGNFDNELKPQKQIINQKLDTEIELCHYATVQFFLPTALG